MEMIYIIKILINIKWKDKKECMIDGKWLIFILNY